MILVLYPVITQLIRIGLYTPYLSTSSHILEKQSLQNKSTRLANLSFLIKNSSIDNSFFVAFCASVALVTWLSKYSKYYITISHTVYTCSLDRFICDLEKYNWPKYLSKLSLYSVLFCSPYPPIPTSVTPVCRGGREQFPIVGGAWVEQHLSYVAQFCWFPQFVKQLWRHCNACNFTKDQNHSSNKSNQLLILIKIRNTTPSNNRVDFLHNSFTLKISIFSVAYIRPSQTSMMELLLQK